ncbi:MAG: exonuclease subunit SbcC [Desertifilum sp. SIO1I2]|nr:exonuclease subunit SbcC [Desertifilum sp. SIO1I2]
MIPLQLTLKNFLSYREATLDFQGLHTACICGANGAGKSSLLEAIAWCLWGQSRAVTEDSLIHAGMRDMRVNFTFQKDDRTYRAIRSRHAGQSSTLEFQIQAESGFRPLTERGMRATQQLINQHLKLDYDTFVNSAYLRQGRADEFMLKRPTERKEVLASLLHLDQYEALAEQAKERSREFKGQVDLLTYNWKTLQSQVESQATHATEIANLESAIADLNASQDIARQQLQSWQVLRLEQQAQQQQLEWHRTQQHNLTQDYQRGLAEYQSALGRQQEVESLLAQEGAIAQAYSQFQYLQSTEESLSQKFAAHTQVQSQLRLLRDTQTEQIQELTNHLNLSLAQLESLNEQAVENQQILSRQPEIEAGCEQLRSARDRLVQLDRLQLQASTLLQRRNQLQSQIDRSQARLAARLEELLATHQQLQRQQEQGLSLQQAAAEVTDRIRQLENKRVYQQRVLEKGQERRHFMERLQADQRNYELQLGEILQKLQMLQTQVPEPEVQEFPPCPLCDRPLDEHHWNLVLLKHQTKQQEIQDQLWVLREQLVTSEREIQILRSKYRELERELSQLTPALEKRGQLQAHLSVTGEMSQRLQQLSVEAAQIERSLNSGEYALDLQAELQTIDAELQALGYDEKDHALVRGQVDRWRWAEIKQAEIKSTQKRQAQILTQRPEIEAQIAQLQRRLEQLQTSSQLHRQIETLEQQLAELNYSLDEHNQVRSALRQAQSAQLRYQQLQQAKQQYPQLQQTAQELAVRLEVRQQELNNSTQKTQELQQKLLQNPDAVSQIQTLEQQIYQRREQLDEQLAKLGRLQQQQQYLETRQTQLKQLKAQLAIAKRQYRVYQELAQAFGKNGIQSLMIENVLPQLEAETNAVLSRLSANQLHVQFVTQKAGRSSKGKIIETLDILIADARGTRPYETYSGGEAFRINFSIRLALAKLLAQRAGTSLQMLIVDEGFGTQDREGCDRLVAAINAIAPDFACILTITHMPYFKEAFQARIEITKNAEGSQLVIL